MLLLVFTNCLGRKSTIEPFPLVGKEAYGICSPASAAACSWRSGTCTRRARKSWSGPPVRFIEINRCSFCVIILISNFLPGRCWRTRRPCRTCGTPPCCPRRPSWRPSRARRSSCHRRKSTRWEGDSRGRPGWRPTLK